MKDKIRIDKWLWAVRLFKTRNQANELCKNGMVKILDMKVKPSREIRVGDTVSVKKNQIYRTYEVFALSNKRMPAQEAIKCYKETTSQEQLVLLNEIKTFGFERRKKGLGRPTKYNRRLIEKFKNI